MSRPLAFLLITLIWASHGYGQGFLSFQIPYLGVGHISTSHQNQQPGTYMYSGRSLKPFSINLVNRGMYKVGLSGTLLDYSVHNTNILTEVSNQIGDYHQLGHAVSRGFYEEMENQSASVFQLDVSKLFKIRNWFDLALGAGLAYIPDAIITQSYDYFGVRPNNLRNQAVYAINTQMQMSDWNGVLHGEISAKLSNRLRLNINSNMMLSRVRNEISSERLSGLKKYAVVNYKGQESFEVIHLSASLYYDFELKHMDRPRTYYDAIRKVFFGF